MDSIIFLLYYLETDLSSSMYGIFTFFMVSTQSQLEATIYNMTSKAFTSTNIINVKGTITVNWMYFRNNTLLYMYGYDNSVDSQ